MSWATYYSDEGSNNIHFDKPPKVSDGRFYTSYISSEATNEQIKSNVKFSKKLKLIYYLYSNYK